YLSYVHNHGSEPLRSLTLGQLLEQTAKKYGSRTALICRSENQKLTFQEVLDQADRLAAGFTALGLKPGDRLGVWAPNVAEWYLTHMASARGGFVLVNINPAYQPRELESCVNLVGVKALVCMSQTKNHDYYGNLVSLCPEMLQSRPGKLRSKAMPTLENIVIAGGTNLRGTLNYHDVLNMATEAQVDKVRKLQGSIDPDQLCHLQFTSIVNNSYCIGKRHELGRKHHSICIMVPFFHGIGTVITICSALNYGSTLVVPAPLYNPEKTLDAIRDEKCSVIIGTPTMYVDLVDRQKARNEDIDPEIAISGGAICSPHLFKQMKDVLKLKKVKSVYGLTEVTAVAFQSLYDDDERQATSTVGYVGDHLEVKVINEEGRIVPRGSPGELCIRGYSTTLGYWKNEEKTQELIGADKWLRTGDQFVLDEKGYGSVVGRIKELIIRGGENIFPGEIESLLNTHPEILECHVVAVPHERLGEEVCACVRTKSAVALTLEEVQAFCQGKIAHFKVPSRLELLESFPKTASGKIQKFKLVETIVAQA
ncbi:hypothetical protein D910_04358, partial [Dendroctonus ponderosae]